MKESAKTSFAGLLSEDSSKVTASYTSPTPFVVDGALPTYTVTVDSIAAGQSNVGAVLPSEEAILPEGSYSFLASFGEESYSFVFGLQKNPLPLSFKVNYLIF